MRKRIKKQPKNEDADIAIVRNTTLPLEERRSAFIRLREKNMNPKTEAEFDPLTFDPMEDHPDAKLGGRSRVEPPRRLPNKGMHPKQILDGQMVGMFESKQDLYLLIAWLSERVSDLEDQLNQQ